MKSLADKNNPTNGIVRPKWVTVSIIWIFNVMSMTVLRSTSLLVNGTI